MLASTRRSLALLSAAAIALAACADDDGDPAAAPEGDGQELSPEDLEDGELPDELQDQLDQEQPPAFDEDDLEDGEVLPGVVVDVSGADATQAQPAPMGGGAIFEAQYSDQAASVLVVVEPVEVSIDELSSGVEQQLEQDENTNLTADLQDVEVSGADAARLAEFEGSTPDGAEAVGSLLIATVDANVVQLVTEMQPDSDFDSQSIIDTLQLDAERLSELAGDEQMMPEQAPEQAPEGQLEDPEGAEPEDPEADEDE